MKKKLIEPAPPISLTGLETHEKAGAAIGTLSPLLLKANNEYLYWTKFKQIIPRDTKPELAWSLLKVSRESQLQTFPLKAVDGDYFKFWLPDSALKSLHAIDINAGGRIGVDAKSLTSSRQQYLISSLMEEAIASSQIEGASTTRKAAKELLRTGRKPTNQAEKMIVNNFRAILEISKLKANNLTPEMIYHIHEIITKGTLEDPRDAGRLRQTDDISVGDVEQKYILHVPPLAKELPERIDALCDFVNSESSSARFIHPAIKAILTHFWLAYEHPFVDGNGRTARALFYWHMLAHEYWLFEFLPISKIILGSRGQYDRAYLHAEQDGLDATYFIIYHLKAIENALKELEKYLARKQAELTKIDALLKGNRDLNHRQLALIRHAIDNPGFIYTIESQKNSHNVSYRTARYDLLSLAEQKLLIAMSPVKGKRKWQFQAPGDLASKLSEKRSTEPEPQLKLGYYPPED